MKRIVKCVITLLFSLILFSYKYEYASATEVAPIEPMIYIEKYEISNERIVPGENFTLSITLKNYSGQRTAKDVSINIQNPEGVAPVYGTISQKFIGDIEAGVEKTISFEYDSWTSIKRETLDFYVTISSNATNNNTILRVPSSADIPFSLLAIDVSSEAKVGEYNSAALTIKVLGEENVSDVVLNVYYNGNVIGSSQAGSITAGTTKTQSTTFILDEVGVYPLVFSLDYVDSDGKKNSVLMHSQEITVTESLNNGTNLIQPSVEELSNSNNLMILGISGILILVIFVLIIIIIRKQR